MPTINIVFGLIVLGAMGVFAVALAYADAFSAEARR